MAISFHSHEISFTLKDKRKISLWVQNTIRKEKHSPGDITYIFCSDDYLLEINRKFLKHNYLTDIITFDYSDNQTIGGDLFISIDRVRENAEKFSHTFADELHRVIIHGVLHLCGYKDKTSAQEKEIRTKENYYLKKRDFK